jgi:oligopeptide/dipeptide ABC transporter ATP-binding protein
MNLLLKVEKLSTEFSLPQGKLRAIEKTGFELSSGEAVGLVGESGCGKSVTALSVMRLILPPGEIVEGSVYFKGKDLLTLPEKDMEDIRGKELSMVFQEPLTSLNPVFTIGSQIEEVVLKHLRLKKREAREKVLEMLRLVGISRPGERFFSYPHQFSGGMRQRVMIAMALCCQPLLLLADEPTTALDVTVQAQILELLKSLKEKFGLAVLFITHDLGIVAQLTERVLIMYAGEVVEQGLTSDIFKKKEKHPYTQGLLDSLPHLREKRIPLKTIRGQVPDMLNPPSGCRFHPRCPLAMEVCLKEKPESINLGDTHWAKCHYYR